MTEIQSPQPAPAGFPASIWSLLLDVADRKGKPGFGPWQTGDGEPMQDDADAAIAWLKAAAIQAPEGARTVTVELAADEVLVALKRGEGYEDVHPELVSEDAIGDRWPEYRTIHGADLASKQQPTAAACISANPGAGRPDAYCQDVRCGLVGQCNRQESAPAEAHEAALRQNSTVYLLNDKGTNRWSALVQPGHDDNGRRVSDAECEAVAEAIRSALASRVQPKGMPLTETREYKHAMGNWLGAVGELIEAMGRPKFAADTPVAVIAEAIREAAKRLAAQAPAPAPERAAWVPYLSDRADGVAGHYAIARWNPAGYREVWNLRSHRWASASDDVMSLEEADSLLRQIVIPTVKPAPVAQTFTEGHCAEKRKPGGCQLHNLHCGYPACDRKAATSAPAVAHGHKVTPYEPTQEMIGAVKRFDPALPLEHIRAIWWAMWGASQPPVQGSQS